MTTERDVKIKVNLVPGDTSALTDAARKATSEIKRAQDEIYKFKDDAGPSGRAEGLKSLLATSSGGGAGPAAAAKPAASAFTGLAVSAGIATAAIGSAIAIFEKLASSAIGFARVASPASADRLDAAWQDLYGVIGRELVPVIDLFTEAVRTLADAMAGAAELNPLLGSFKQALAEIGFVLKTIHQAGIESGFMRSSVGAAARPAQIGNVGSYLNRAYTSAASSGSGGGKTVPSILELILKDTNVIATIVAGAKSVRQALGGNGTNSLSDTIRVGMWHTIFGAGAKPGG